MQKKTKIKRTTVNDIMRDLYQVVITIRFEYKIKLKNERLIPLPIKKKNTKEMPINFRFQLLFNLYVGKYQNLATEPRREWKCVE